MAGALNLAGAPSAPGLPPIAIMAGTVSAPSASLPASKRVMPIQNWWWGFSQTEAMQVWAGVVVMTFAFALAYIGGAANVVLYFYIGGVPLILLILVGSFFAVLTAFFAHEIAHKAVAQRYGAVAEFRHSPVGLLFGLISASIGVMIAMPGAVVITGAVTPKQQMKISAAGPVINLACAAVFMGVSVALGTAPGRFREPIPIIIGAIAFVNVLLAMFNLIPVRAIALKRQVAGRPLSVTLPASDGYLILAASRPAWAACVTALLILGVGGRFLAVF